MKFPTFRDSEDIMFLYAHTSSDTKKKTVDVSGDFLCFAVFIYEEREHTMLDRFYSNRSQDIFTMMVGGYLKSTEDDIYKDSKS